MYVYNSITNHLYPPSPTTSLSDFALKVGTHMAKIAFRCYGGRRRREEEMGEEDIGG